MHLKVPITSKYTYFMKTNEKSYFKKATDTTKPAFQYFYIFLLIILPIFTEIFSIYQYLNIKTFFESIITHP